MLGSSLRRLVLELVPLLSLLLLLSSSAASSNTSFYASLAESACACPSIRNASPSLSLPALQLAHLASTFSLLAYINWEGDRKLNLTLPRSIAIGAFGGDSMQRLAWALDRMRCRMGEQMKRMTRARRRTCAVRGASASTFRVKWFFNNFREDMWHDTELLIGESHDTLVIAFRGSDSRADVATNVQTMEPSASNAAYPHCPRGALHRGIYNAYKRVRSGTLVDLTAGGPYLGADALLREELRAHAGDGNATSATVHALLSTLLKNVVLASLRRGMRVLITGHSLGGALATLLALDILTAVRHNAVPTGLLARVRGVLTHLERMGGGRHAEDAWLVLHRMSLVTFGEVEYADETLLRCLRAHPLVSSFVERGNYRRFVSVTKAPRCKSDVVTRVVTKVMSPIPRLLTGVGGGRLERRMRARLEAKGGKAGTAMTHLVEASHLCGGWASSTLDAHSMRHYAQGLARLARLRAVALVTDMSSKLAAHLRLSGACFNNSNHPSYYGFEC